MVFFEAGKRVLGFNRENFQLMLNIKFDTYVTYGDVSCDERIFVADAGARTGVFGEQMFVIEKDGEVEKFNVFPNARAIKLFNNRLVVSNAAYTEKGYTGLQIFDTDGYQLLYETKELGNIITRRNIQIYQDELYIAVPPLKSLNRTNYIFRLNLMTMESEKVFKFTELYPYDLFDILINGKDLIIVFNDSKKVCIYDIETGSLKTTIDITAFVDIPESNLPLDYWFSSPVIIGNDLVFLLVDNLPDIIYQKVVIFDKNTWQFKKTVELDPKYNLRFFTLRYVTGDYLWIEDGFFIGIYNYQNGELIHEIDLNHF